MKTSNSNKRKNTLDPNLKKGILFAVKIVISMIGFALVFSSNGSKCSYPGCDSKPLSNSKYCALHELKVKSDRRISEQKQTTAVTTTRQTSAPKATNKTPPHTNTKPTATQSPDPYDAYEYYDPEDFYYDHYDDFFDYEDAEDYWYSYN